MEYGYSGGGNQMRAAYSEDELEKERKKRLYAEELKLEQEKAGLNVADSAPNESAPSSDKSARLSQASKALSAVQGINSQANSSNTNEGMGALSGAATGASLGMAAGPYAAAGLGVAGAFAGVSQAKRNKAIAAAKIEADKLKKLGDIEVEKQDRIQSALGQMRNSFSRALNNNLVISKLV